MSALERYTGGALATAPRGARQLGTRVKPIIRLGMGFRDENRRGAPVKTDYFTVRGDERVVKKFGEVYGDKPKAVRIMVPSALELALDISYRSFVGGQSEDGGRPLALGMTNFAPLGYVGGPDVLRVWAQDGTYREVETEGLDELGKPLDEIAADLKIEVHTTFTFTIPDVIGWGSFAAVTSKGKKSADNLAFKLNEIYSAFGSKAPWAFDRDDPPLLVLKPDSALMRFEEKDGSAKWGKTKIFVLDVVIPEAFDEMRDRLLERQAAIGDPAAALYGPSQTIEQAALERGTPGSGTAPADSRGGQAHDALVGQQAEETEPSTDGNGHEQTVSSAPDFDGEEPAARTAPPGEGDVPEPTFGSGRYAGKTIVEIYSEGKDGIAYIKWAVRNWKSDPMKTALAAFAEHHEEVR